MENLTKPGQIKAGDTVLCDFKDKPQKYRVKDVINAGTDKEEILINKKKNIYFITSMAIDGSSWAKKVRFVSAK